MRGCVDKKVKFFGVAEGRFPSPLRCAWADRAQIFTHHVPFEVLCACWVSSPSVEFWGSYATDPLFRIVTIRLAIYYMAGHNKRLHLSWGSSLGYPLYCWSYREARSIAQQRRQTVPKCYNLYSTNLMLPYLYSENWVISQCSRLAYTNSLWVIVVLWLLWLKSR